MFWFSSPAVHRGPRLGLVGRAAAKFVAVAILMALAVVSGEVQAELIVNGGFETPGGNTSTPTGWAKDGDAYGTYDGVSGNPTIRIPPTHGGSWSATPGMGASTTVGLYQTLGTSLVAGDYKLEFWSTPWFAGNGNDVRVGKYSGSGTLDNVANWTSLALNVVDIPTVAAGSWELRSYAFTAIGGEDTVYFGTGIAGRNDGADIDDVSLTLSPSAVPEIDPAGLGSVLALLGGVVGLVERRRLKVA